MENYTDGFVTAAKATEENFIAGIVGAFLFSLAGVIIRFLIYQFGLLPESLELSP
jgi:hypothetical protein